jgi:hypothetical protein
MPDADLLFMPPPRLGAFVTVMDEHARADARQAERRVMTGATLGALLAQVRPSAHLRPAA